MIIIRAMNRSQAHLITGSDIMNSKCEGMLFCTALMSSIMLWAGKAARQTERQCYQETKFRI